MIGEVHPILAIKGIMSKFETNLGLKTATTETTRISSKRTTSKKSTREITASTCIGVISITIDMRNTSAFDEIRTMMEIARVEIVYAASGVICMKTRSCSKGNNRGINLINLLGKKTFLGFQQRVKLFQEKWLLRGANRCSRRVVIGCEAIDDVNQYILIFNNNRNSYQFINNFLNMLNIRINRLCIFLLDGVKFYFQIKIVEAGASRVTGLNRNPEIVRGLRSNDIGESGRQ